MERRQLGKTGLEVSVIGFGSAPVGFLGAEIAETGRLLGELLDSGINLIDTAAAYPGSEEMIGATIAARRDEFHLVSKCGAPGSDSDDPSWTAEALRESIDRSLSRLRTDVLDVILLHSCTLETLRQGEALQALEEARQAGKVRFIGYSGDNEAAAYAAALPEIAVLETSVNICDQANIDNVLPIAQQHGVGVVAKRPVANACWKQLSEQRGMYQQYAQVYTERLAKMKVDPAELGFEQAPHAAWPGIALRFTLSQPGVHTAIIGTTNRGHAVSNIAEAEKGPLPVEAVEKLRYAFHQAEAAAGGGWLGQI